MVGCNDMGFLCFKRDAAITNNSNGDTKQLANLVNLERQP